MGRELGVKVMFFELFGHFKSFKIWGTTQQEGDLPKTFPSPPLFSI